MISSFFPDGGFQDFIRRHHHAKVNDIIPITTQHHTHNIFSDIMHIAFNGGQ